MASTPLVSVLMTAFNREKFIGPAIESVLNSTYTNFELIIVDDCSIDNTVAVARNFEKKDSRVKLYINEKNLGDYVNRNKAASYAKGKYLKYLDSDDALYSYGLEVMVRGMEQYPVAALGMAWYWATSEPLPALVSSYDVYCDFFFRNVWMQVGPSGAIYRRDTFEQLGGFSGKPYVGDFELNLKLSARYPVVKFQSGLFFYREHDTRQTIEQGKNIKVYYLTHRVMVDALMDKHCPLNKAEIANAFKTINKLQARRTVYVWLVKRKFNVLKPLVVESKLGWPNFFKGLLTINVKIAAESGQHHSSRKSLTDLHIVARTYRKAAFLFTWFRGSVRQNHWKALFGHRLKLEKDSWFAPTTKIQMDNSASSIRIGRRFQAREYCFFRAEKNGELTIGDNVFFNNHCSVTCLGKITIGNNCQFGEGVKMYDHNHIYADRNVLISSQGYTIGTITIGNNCWIGSNVVILKDVTIGDNVVIGAGCVIHKSIAPGSLVYNQQNLQIINQ